MPPTKPKKSKAKSKGTIDPCPKARPFVKWAGGKRQLLLSILHRLPRSIDRYYEPFVGGGAVFFALNSENRFQQAILGDRNAELMTAYATLSDPLWVESVIARLKTYQYDAEFYDALRKLNPADLTEVEATSRFIYLNRTGFNGLYRVNRKGSFNVPLGRYSNPTICDETNLRLISKALHQDRVRCLCTDFEAQVRTAQPGDVVYFDPPYIPLSVTSNFTEYQPGGFGLTEHTRLAACFRRLADKGVGVLLSNSNTPIVQELYAGFQIDIVSAKRAINSKGGRRGPVTEVLVQANLR